jgi:hypothetical protein
MRNNRIQFIGEFPYYHQLNGMPTGFKESILSGKKIHTVRGNKSIYQEIKEEIDKGNTTILLWTHDNVSDGSGVDTFKTAINCHYTTLNKRSGNWYVGEYWLPIKEITLAINDGLTLMDFRGFWPLDDYDNLTLFYLSEFDYEEENDKLTYPKDYFKGKKPRVKITFQATIEMGDVLVKRKQHFEK